MPWCSAAKWCCRRNREKSGSKTSSENSNSHETNDVGKTWENTMKQVMLEIFMKQMMLEPFCLSQKHVKPNNAEKKAGDAGPMAHSSLASQSAMTVTQK